MTDLPSPGGWLQLYGVRVARALMIGTVGGAIAGLTIYGTFNGAQGTQFCEAQLTSATKDWVTYSCLNPLPNNETGAVLATNTNGIYAAENTSPKTRVNVCTASGATQTCPSTTAGTNIASGADLSGGAKRWLALSGTGGMKLAKPAILAPATYPSPAKNRINVTFVNGSGQTLSGNPPAFIRLEVLPCNLSGVGC